MPRAYGTLPFLQDGNAEGFFTASNTRMRHPASCRNRATYGFACDGLHLQEGSHFGKVRQESLGTKLDAFCHSFHSSIYSAINFQPPRRSSKRSSGSTPAP